MIKAAVVGGTGYTGVELLRLLAGHPNVEVAIITSRAEAGIPVAEYFPQLVGVFDLKFQAPDLSALETCDIVFFATPNGTAMQLVPDLLASNVRVIDLAADFRLRDAKLWEQYYKAPHACPELLAKAVYGLPELNRESIRDATLVANPGCYPTAVTLGFLPVLAKQLVEPQSLIADAKSGVSGAGRQAKIANLFSEVAEDFRAYGVPGHRHLPEILQTLRTVGGQDQQLIFVPHLVPMIRGIHATLYCRIKAEMRENVDLQAVFEEFYEDEYFVRVMPHGSHPATSSVRGSNHCQIAVHQLDDKGNVVILAVEDNLVKGAAGQAVQNMNIMFGFDESTGLNNTVLWP